jgi:hypothetical protein
MNIAIFSCDPGGHTGLAWGLYPPYKSRSFEDCLAAGIHTGSTTIGGSAREQIPAIVGQWQEFYHNAVEVALLPPTRVYLVMEDYVYRQDVRYSGEDSKISISVIWGVEGYRMGQRDEWLKSNRKPGPRSKANGVQVFMPPMILQTATEAKTYATNARMREWGVWIKGRDHEQSAMAHLVTFLSRFRREQG